MSSRATIERSASSVAPPPNASRWAWASLAPAAALSIAILVVPSPPFLDFPWHMASATIDAQFDAVATYRRYYSLNHTFGPNSIAHSIAVQSGHPRGAMLGLTVLSLLGSWGMIVLLARRYRTGPTFPLIAGLFVIHRSLTYGFVEFEVGVPMMFGVVWLLSLAPVVALSGGSASGDGGRRMLPLLAWAVALMALQQALFFAHAILCIFCLCVVVAFVARLSVRRSAGTAIAAGLAMVPAVASIAIWKLARRSDRGQMQWLGWYYQLGYLPEFPQRAIDFFTADHGALIGPVAGPAFATGVVVIALCACVYLWWREAIDARAAAGRSADERDPSAGAAARAFFITSALAVLLAPPGLPPFWYVYQRFTFALLISGALLACTAARGVVAPRRLVHALAALNIVVGAMWFEHVWSFRHVTGDLIALARSTPLDGIGASVTADTHWRGDPLTLLHAADLMTVFARRPVQSSLYDFPQTSVKRGPDLGAKPIDEPSFKNVGTLMPWIANFQWVLVHRSVSESDRAALSLFATPCAQRGDWTLYTIRSKDDPVTGTTP